ncbi:MAG: sulfotransferase, partial [Candidatus Neomarinimicrobiota bacterium]|nr:sulfotransferase [Candidatus Neomarinimicrobiota bacterium]
MKLNRKLKAYITIGKTFGVWVSPITTGLFLFIMRTIVSIGLFIDKLFYKIARKPYLKSPIVIVGNPRSGTTFLQRYLIKSNLGRGAQLWQLIYPSIVLQKLIKPLLPILEKISPARHHSTAAHKTSLSSVETDDVGLFFRYFDGFFLYGFLLSFAEEDLFEYFDPKVRDTSKRDFDWFENIWSRTVVNQDLPYIGKLFSLSTNLPAFQKRFPDAKILYMVRDPLNVIPSGLSLVTGVLDKRFGFWSLNKDKRDQYI